MGANSAGPRWLGRSAPHLNRDNDVILVTGAGGGMGSALCHHLLRQGRHLVATDSNVQRLALFEREWPAGQAQAISERLDLADAEAFHRVVDETLARFGRITSLINHAGIVSSAAFSEVEPARWQRFIDINLMGVVNGCRAVVAPMSRQGHGHIVNVSSKAGTTPVLNAAPYVATKHAVVGLIKALREELSGRGVVVHLVIPGLIDAGIFDRSANRGGLSSRALADNTPIPKLPPARAAEIIVRGVDRSRTEICFPLINPFTVRAYRWFPRLMSRAIVRCQVY